MKLSLSVRRRFANRYLELGRDLDAAAEEFGYTRAIAMYVLKTPEAKEICGEQDVIDEMFAAFTQAELGFEYFDALKKAKGLEPVPYPVVDRDGNVEVHMICKYHPAEVRGLLSDLAKIAGLMRPADINVHMKTVTFDMSGVDDEEPSDSIPPDEPLSLPNPEELH